MWDVVRWINVVLAMGAVCLLVSGTIQRWHDMPKRIQRIAPWVACTYVIVAYGSGEAAAQDAEPWLRVLLMTLNLCGLLIALLYRFGAASYDE